MPPLATATIWLAMQLILPISCFFEQFYGIILLIPCATGCTHFVCVCVGPVSSMHGPMLSFFIALFILNLLFHSGFIVLANSRIKKVFR